MNARPSLRPPAASRLTTATLGAARLMTLLAICFWTVAVAGAPAEEPPGFAVHIEPDSVVAIQGEQAAVTVTVVPEEGFAGEVSLALGALPFDTEAAISEDGTMTLTLGRRAHVGDHTVTFVGVSDEMRESASFRLRVLQSQPLAAAFAHTLAVAEDGSLHSWGQNDHGQLGLGDADARSTPVPVGADRRWVAVAGGRDHSIALAVDGTIWGAGSNQRGQLGTEVDQSLEFQQIGEASHWVAVGAGDHFSLAISADGSLWLWGQNRYGQVGNGVAASVTAPQRLAGVGWVVAEAGADHTVAVRADGSLWAWGYNGYGQLGTGDTKEHREPVQVGSDTDWLTASAGGSATVALKRDGTVWAWGQNNSGQLGLGHNAHVSEPQEVDLATVIVDVSLGTGFAVVLGQDGAAGATGSGAALGIAQQANVNAYAPVVAGQGFAYVSAGGTHTVALSADGTATTWGSNDHGQLGLGAELARGTGTVSGLTVRWP